MHANTPRAGLMGAIAHRLGGPPLVVRAHEHVPQDSQVGRGVRAVLARSASAIVTVSQEVERRFNHGLDRPVATHIYNSFDRERFDPDRVSRPASARSSALGRMPGCSARSPRSRRGRPRTPRSALWRSCAATARTRTC